MEGGGGFGRDVGTLRAEAALTAMCVERGRWGGVDEGWRYVKEKGNETWDGEEWGGGGRLHAS